MEHGQNTYARDLISAVLYSGTRFALGPLIAFIAVKRLGASVTWVGILNGAMFVGFAVRSAALIATLVVALFCGAMVWIPGVDGRPG